MEAVVRYRATIVMGVLLIVVVLAAVLAKGTKPGGAARGNADVPRVVFGSQVKIPGATGPLTYTNGWSAINGKQLIAVYAGREAADPRNGRFVILRRSGGHQRLVSVTVPGSGAVTLLRPAPPASEQAAYGETVHFVTANGATGTLSLSTDSVKLSG